MVKRYTAKDVQVLDEITHIQLNAGMYVGGTETPAHLVEECLDNALDEAQGGHGSIIAVNIDTKTGVCAVLDNGRGIPLSDNTPVRISSKLFSGAKFQDRKTAYEIASGLHGVGLCAVSALSDHYLVEVYRNNKHGVFRFANGKLKSKSIKPYTDKKPFSTKIEFKPSKKIFENLIPDVRRIKRRLSTASAELSKDITFILNVDDKRELFKLTLDEHFMDHIMHDGEQHVGLMKFSALERPEAFHVMMTYAMNGSVSPRVLSSVNLLPVDSGGTHVNALYEILRDFFVAKGKKLGFNFMPADCLMGLRAYLMLSLKEPKFSGQTKDKLTNRKATLGKFVTQLKAKIEAHFAANPEQLTELLERFAEYRARLNARKVKAKTNGKRASTKFTKLRDCTSSHGELFIVEGDSAGGGFVECRDPKKHAILPLRGKIPNAVNAKDIIKNKEVSEMIMALGTGVGPDFDISGLKYDKIICATDADEDGAHIFCLVTLILATLVPDVIRNGHYYLVETPLYAINEKKNFVPLWTDDEIQKAKKENKPIVRLKGLVELNPDQLGEVAINEKKRKLVPIKMTSNITKMSKLFSGADQKRKLLEGTWEI